MMTLIHFILRFYLDCLFVIIILYEMWGIVKRYPLDRATSLLPRVLFVIELESYGKNDQFVNVYGDVPLLCQSL